MYFLFIELFKGGDETWPWDSYKPGLDTTELISIYPPYARKGPITLPYKVRDHCSLLVGEKIFLIGDFTTFKKVLSININNGEIEVMEKTSYEHFRSGCASFLQGNKSLIAVAGGYYIENYSNDFGYRSVTEIYDIQENAWKIGIA